MSNFNDGIQEMALPEIIGALPNFPGSQYNLIPIDQLSAPLRVAIPQFTINPTLPPDRPILLTLHSGLKGHANPVESHTLITPIDPELFPFFTAVAPGNFQTEGVYDVFYSVTYAGATDHSAVSNFTVDKTSPNAGNPGKEAAFPKEVIQYGITSQYLAAYDDKVNITINRYLDQQVGDVINFYFGSLAENPVLDITVHDSDSDTVVTLSGDIIRAKGNGAHYAFYSLADRAGSVGPHSRYLPVNVFLDEKK